MHACCQHCFRGFRSRRSACQCLDHTPHTATSRFAWPSSLKEVSKIVNYKTYILTTRIAALCTYPEQPVCTSLLFTLLFIKSQYTFCFLSFFAHLLFCTSHLFSTFYSIAHFILISLFYHIYALVLRYFYIIFYSFALSTERTWFWCTFHF